MKEISGNMKGILPAEPNSIPELRGFGDTLHYHGCGLSTFRDGFRYTLLVKLVDSCGIEQQIMYPSFIWNEISLHSGLKFHEPTYSTEETHGHGKRLHCVRYSAFECAEERCNGRLRVWVWDFPTESTITRRELFREYCFECNKAGHRSETCCQKIGFARVELWPHNHLSWRGARKKKEK